MSQSTKPKHKICYAYTDPVTGEETRTRFFKYSSKEVLKKIKASLKRRNIPFEEMTRPAWENKHGRINKPRSVPMPHVDISMLPKTEDMVAHEHKQRLKRKAYRNKN